MRMFGPSAQTNFKWLMEYAKRLAKNDTKQSARLTERESELHELLALVDGSAYAPAAGGFARAVQTWRIINYFKLGKAARRIRFAVANERAVDHAIAVEEDGALWFRVRRSALRVHRALSHFVLFTFSLG